MGKKTAPAAPPAPDPMVVASAQGAANAETARLQQKMNMVNQYNPYGSVIFTPIGDDRYRQDINLSGLGQQAFDSQQRIDAATNNLAEQQLGRLSSTLATPVDFSGLPALPGAGDFSSDRDKVTQGLIDRNSPQMQQQRAALESQLANQGVMRGSDAWRAAVDDLARQENDFRLAALSAGGQEQSRLFGLGQSARQQALSEYMQQRSAPINEIAALLGTGQVAVPEGGGIPQTNVGGTDVVGPYNMQYQGQLAAFNAKNARQQNLMSGLASLGGQLGSMAIYKSDSRLKRDVTRIGYHGDIPLYTFRYKADPQGIVYRGVMAQDVLNIMPEAVIEDGNYYAVDYDKLGIEFRRVN